MRLLIHLETGRNGSLLECLAWIEMENDLNGLKNLLLYGLMDLVIGGLECEERTGSEESLGKMSGLC
jgi:hypothetical protein